MYSHKPSRSRPKTPKNAKAKALRETFKNFEFFNRFSTRAHQN